MDGNATDAVHTGSEAGDRYNHPCLNCLRWKASDGCRTTASSSIAVLALAGCEIFVGLCVGLLLGGWQDHSV